MSVDVARLREFVVAHTLLDKGITDFELNASAVERFREASGALVDIIRPALAARPDGEADG